MTEQEFKDKVAEILRDYSTYSGQVRAYVIHGALDKIWELHCEEMKADNPIYKEWAKPENDHWDKKVQVKDLNIKPGTNYNT